MQPMETPKELYKKQKMEAANVVLSLAPTLPIAQPNINQLKTRPCKMFFSPSGCSFWCAPPTAWITTLH
jgi:hypothetical protein